MSLSSKRLGEIVNAQSEILRQREAVTEQEILKRYGQAATRIETETNKTMRQVEQLRASGEPLDSAMFRLNRYQSLQQQIDSEIQKVTGPVLRQVQTNQAFAAGLGQQTAFQTTHAVLDSDSPSRVAVTGIMSDWTRLPKDALDDLIGFMSNGKPLLNMLENISSATAEHATRILTEGLAIGKNPRVVAREMRQSTGMAANRALTISRTEMLRSYRESSRRAFVANAHETGGVVKGWVWHCALDSRCCSCCVAMHGQVFKVEEKQNGHPNCRCAMVPKTATWEELGFDNIPDTNPEVVEGEEWFSKQPESIQKAILGPGKLNLYRGNRIMLADTVTVKVNPVWGSVRSEASIAESLQNAKMRRAVDSIPEHIVDNIPIPVKEVEQQVELKPLSELRQKMQEGINPVHQNSLVYDWVEENQSSRAISRTRHGMSESEKMFNVEFEGIRYHFPDELREEFVQSLQNLVNAEPIPESLSKHTREIYMTMQGNANDVVLSERYGMDFVTSATGGDGSIVFYNAQEINYGTLTHEMGHNLAPEIYDAVEPTLESEFGQAILSSEPPVSEYGTFNDAEDFAESMKAYFTRREEMKENYPLRYNAIKNLLE